MLQKSNFLALLILIVASKLQVAVYGVLGVLPLCRQVTSIAPINSFSSANKWFCSADNLLSIADNGYVKVVHQKPLMPAVGLLCLLGILDKTNPMSIKGQV